MSKINKRKKPTTKLSEELSKFLDLTKLADAKYNTYKKKIEEFNDKVNKGNHLLEFNNRAEERSKISTKIHLIRKLRRKYKDQQEVLEPLYHFMQTKEGKQAINKLQEVLGKMRKAERYHEERHYIYDISYLEIDEKDLI